MLGRRSPGPVPRGNAGGPAAHAVTNPTTWDLLADAWAGRVGALRRLPATLRTLRAGRAELGDGPRAPRCSLNAPTGALRGMHLAEVDLEAARAAAHAGAATVNDLLLVAVVAALGRAARQERRAPRRARGLGADLGAPHHATGADLGNDVGVMPIRVPLTGPLEARLAEVAAETRVSQGSVVLEGLVRGAARPVVPGPGEGRGVRLVREPGSDS